ncbi:hypothetical protein AB0H43_13430 [Hamadaea sp. NPDC050747]|uniref:restriction endonuclease-related protein n=1 Tax=Hamadaea sp. NPDC050747 TaxID=3155789 RepID=UPI0033DF3980
MIIESAATDEFETRSRITTAALRAAFAWSARSHELRAVEELARMTGVIMFEHGPGRGPVTPMDLVRLLRQPMRNLWPASLAGESADPALDDLVLLTAGDALSDDAYDVGSDYICGVMAGRDPARDWLPSWAWMRANDVEEQVFGALRKSGDPLAYTVNRRFIVEHPAGHQEEVADACNMAGAQRLARYIPMPSSKLYRNRDGVWWWPCPVCRWPMAVEAHMARCAYRHHRAVFQIVDTPGRLHLLPTDPDGHLRSVAYEPQIPAAQPADGAIQVDEPVWRFIVVPGASELRMWTALDGHGVPVVLYPGFDRCDLDIADGRWEADVKEHNSVGGLLRHLEDKPLKATHLVLPQSHAGQANGLRGRIPQRVLTENELYKEVLREYSQAGA